MLVVNDNISHLLICVSYYKEKKAAKVQTLYQNKVQTFAAFYPMHFMILILRRDGISGSSFHCNLHLVSAKSTPYWMLCPPSCQQIRSIFPLK